MLMAWVCIYSETCFYKHFLNKSTVLFLQVLFIKCSILYIGGPKIQAGGTKSPSIDTASTSAIIYLNANLSIVCVTDRWLFMLRFRLHRAQLHG